MSKRKVKEPRCCKACHAPERKIIGGMYTTIAPHLGICADCINRWMKTTR